METTVQGLGASGRLENRGGGHYLGWDMEYRVLE